MSWRAPLELAGRAAWPFVRAAGDETRWIDRWHGAPVRTPVSTWIHTASLGEVAPLADLIEELAAQQTVGITVTSGRSFRAVADRFVDLADVRPLPAPASPARARLLATWGRGRLIFLEAELWPGLAAGVARAGGEVAVLAGRLGPARRLLLAALLRMSPLEGQIAGVWAVDEEEAREYGRAGVPAEQVRGGFLAKLLRTAPAPVPAGFPSWRREGHLHVVAGSVHPGEASALVAGLDAHNDRPVRLLVIPRHLQRTEELAAALAAAGHPPARWPATGPVTLVEEYGVLAGLYGLADVAMVGGSWVPHGGHNPVEAIAHGVPVVMGPHHGNQRRLLETLPAAAVTVDVLPGELSSRMAELTRMSEETRRGWQRELERLQGRMTAMAREALGL